MKSPKFLEKPVQYAAKQFNTFKNVIFDKYADKPANMLVHTGVLGWILSSLAQIAAIAFNDKIPAEQKMFLIPQECADAAVNIVSFYAVTKSMKDLGAKLVKTGKLRNPKITKFLKSVKGLDKSKIGTWDMDITKLNGFGGDAKKDFDAFKTGVDVYASVAGSVLSCNIITPILRNRYAAERQKDVLAKMNEKRYTCLQPPRGISMDRYLTSAYNRTSLKV